MSESDWVARADVEDREDPIGDFRDRFCIPQHGDNGEECLYLCGNSLGLMPEATRTALVSELDDWQRLGVEGHFRGRHPWMRYHEEVRDDLATITGALPIEVVAMNSLTVNLHLMMVSFYRPTQERFRIVIEKNAFPSDRYAVESQIRYHGFEPADALVELEDAPGAARVSPDTLGAYLDEHGDSVALILMPGVQYLSGEFQNLGEVCRMGRKHGAAVGLDLAHAVGNVPLKLNTWAPDFAVWCHYKYVNSGPGAVAGCFVSERHVGRRDLPRFAGWWGHEPESRFRMGPEFVPSPSADGWQLSNPPVLALAPVRVSLGIFAEAQMQRLRNKSLRLTGYLEDGIHQFLADHMEILTPLDPKRRGCQLSLRLKTSRDDARRFFERLEQAGVICDWREPDVIRAAPTPLYNRFADVRRFVRTCTDILNTL